jgi:hypothetical protein
VATARPELADRSPDWGRRPPDRTATVTLAPLSDDDTARLLAALLGRAVDQDEAHATLLGRIGGNPLYAEQVCRMLDDRGLLERDGATVRLTAADTVLPDSIHALIAARLDTLTPQGRALLQDAASRYGDACDRWRSFGVVLEHGQALLGLGRCATRLGRPPAREPLLQARQIFARLGVGGLLAETDGWLDGRGGPGGMVGRP